MKKITKTILILFCTVALFSGCKETESILAPMTGAWQCISVSGGALGGVISTPDLETKALNLLSVVYGGALGAGGYARTGSGDITADVSSITGLLSGGDDGVASSWSDYLSTGTFSYTGDNTDGIITMTSRTGLIQEYTYHIYSEGDVTKMDLREEQMPSGLSNAVNTVTNVIGSLFGGASSTVSLLEIVYTYQRVNVTDISNLMN